MSDKKEEIERTEVILEKIRSLQGKQSTRIQGQKYLNVLFEIANRLHGIAEEDLTKAERQILQEIEEAVN
jgi:hypothetical protein